MYTLSIVQVELLASLTRNQSSKCTGMLRVLSCEPYISCLDIGTERVPFLSSNIIINYRFFFLTLDVNQLLIITCFVLQVVLLSTGCYNNVVLMLCTWTAVFFSTVIQDSMFVRVELMDTSS